MRIVVGHVHPGDSFALFRRARRPLAPEGITVAVRIGFDDNRSLGTGETGGRVALPVFKEVVLRAYGEKLLGPAPRFPAEMEQHIDVFLENTVVDTAVVAAPAKPCGDLRLPVVPARTSPQIPTYPASRPPQ